MLEKTPLRNLNIEGDSRRVFQIYHQLDQVTSTLVLNVNGRGQDVSTDPLGSDWFGNQEGEKPSCLKGNVEMVEQVLLNFFVSHLGTQ